MHHLDIGLHEAVGKAAQRCLKDIESFKEIFGRVMERHGSDSEVDQGVRACVHCMGAIPRGMYNWAFECGRYFGSKGLEVQEAGEVELLPRLKPETTVLDVDAVAEGEA